jgi:hypothetical protein
MGSPFSGFIAEAVMQKLEKSVLAIYKPKLYLRYVDDTFVIIKRSELLNFHNLLNSIYAEIQFTREEELNEELSFLDVSIRRNSDNMIQTGVYRKDAYAEVILHYDSNHPSAHKRGCIKSLFDRAVSHCSNENEIEKEKKYLFKLFQSNGYPLNFIRSCLRKPPYSSTVNVRNSQNSSNKQWISLPYIKGTSEALARKLKKHDINIAHKPSCTIRSSIVHPKERMPNMNKRNIVYKIPCRDCPQKYCGQTGKKLESRLHEHSLAVKRRDPKSLVAMHSLDTGHLFNFDETKIVGSAPTKRSREIIEAWNSTGDCLNRHVDLDPIYASLRDHWTKRKPMRHRP